MKFKSRADSDILKTRNQIFEIVSIRKFADHENSTVYEFRLKLDGSLYPVFRYVKDEFIIRLMTDYEVVELIEKEEK